MGGGRKNLKRAAVAGKKEKLIVEDDHSIVQVVSLLGSNSIEVMDAQGAKSLALFPAKFKKLVWIKPGNFVVVDESGKEKATESGSKVTSIVSQIVSSEQVSMLQKSPDWPEIFKAKSRDNSNTNSHIDSSKQKVTESNLDDEEEQDDDDDDDGLPPLEANMNRVRPPEFQSEEDEDTDSDS